jgi:hypothetical protein
MTKCARFLLLVMPSHSDNFLCQTSSLLLSAALLRAILMNHLAHSEASKNAKTVETNLRVKLDALETTNGTLETELRR